jgi:hypothetical protein
MDLIQRLFQPYFVAKDFGFVICDSTAANVSTTGAPLTAVVMATPARAKMVATNSTAFHAFRDVAGFGSASEWFAFTADRGFSAALLHKACLRRSSKRFSILPDGLARARLGVNGTTSSKGTE